MIEPLTKDQLGQLRAAKYIGFARSPQAAYIVAEKGDNRHRVQVADRVHALGGDLLSSVAFCSYTMGTDGPGPGRCWRTITGFLKPGDEIVLDWYRDVLTRGYLDRTDLHGDRLSLVVKRNEKTYEFMVAVEINPDNTSRMILVGKNAEK